jgi:general nucleoside transport system permease protein
MTVDPTILARPTAPATTRARRTLVTAGGILLLVSAVRVVTGATDLTSPGTFGAALTLMVPILLAALGGLYSERAGVVNIGLEGMMILGTWFGAWAGWKYGPWAGVVLGIFGGGLGGLLHALATVTFGIDHVVSGVAINILAGGFTRFLSVVAYPLGSGGSATQSPQVTGGIPNVTFPVLAGGTISGWKSPDLFGWISARHWFLVSDLAGLLKGLTANVSVLALFALALIPISYWVLWRTRLGLRLRSVGEHPMAAESLGVPVYAMKYVGVVLSGMLAGLGGAFLVLESAGIYREGQTGGRGFIGLAALIFGNWRPGGVGAAAGLFGYADALQLRSGKAVHGLLLLVAVAVAAGAVWLLVKRRSQSGWVVLAVAAASFFWYATSDTIPNQFVYMTPYVVTLVVLAVASQRLRPPAADGKPYRKGQAV